MKVMFSRKDGKFLKRTFMDKRDFLQRYEDVLVQVGEKIGAGGLIQPVYKTLGEAWCSHPDHLKFNEGCKMTPGTDLPEGWFNMWQGFNVDEDAKPKPWNKIKYHIEKIVCCDHLESIEYFYNWCAFTLQKPHLPAFSAVCLKGLKGSGKGVMLQFLMSFWEPHTKQVTNPEHLVGKFNAHMADVCFVFADEAFYGGDKKHESVLKGLITEKKMNIERKGNDIENDVPSYLRLVMSTNEEWMVPSTGDERRFFVLEVSKKLNELKEKDRAKYSKYFKDLFVEVEDDGCRLAFFNEMKARDISNFSPGNIPITEATRQPLGSSHLLAKLTSDRSRNTLRKISWVQIILMH
jgi:hypothetical protein